MTTFLAEAAYLLGRRDIQRKALDYIRGERIEVLMKYACAEIP
ncbi:hypothetical protein [Methylomonas methanica]|nr:hypothetical protein [Methylomonas methanica]